MLGTTPPKAEKAGPSKVRTSIGQIEAKIMPSLETNASLNITQTKPLGYKNRTAEAKSCLMKAKLQLGNSRNLKTNIKEDVERAVERRYELVKEAEIDRVKTAQGGEENRKNESPIPAPSTKECENTRIKDDLAKRLEEHGKMLREHKEEMERLRDQMCAQKMTGQETYASIASRPPKRQYTKQTAMHSIIVTSPNDQDTREQILEKVKKALNVKEEGVKIVKVIRLGI